MTKVVHIALVFSIFLTSCSGRTKKDVYECGEAILTGCQKTCSVLLEEKARPAAAKCYADYISHDHQALDQCMEAKHFPNWRSVECELIKERQTRQMDVNTAVMAVGKYYYCIKGCVLSHKTAIIKCTDGCNASPNVPLVEAEKVCLEQIKGSGSQDQVSNCTIRAVIA